MNRRAFFSALPLLPASALGGSRIHREPGLKVRLALNAYSFDKPLRAGTMTLEDIVHFCARHRVDALDATGYYFPGYPKVPPDSYIYGLKRAAFVNGVQLSGTGVRNNFAAADASLRAADIEMVRNWIDVASKLGAPVIRVFSGPAKPEGFTFDQVLAWMIPAFQECAAYGEKRGVMIGLQQHNDFLKTADETIRVIEAVNSDWFGCILDVGSLRQHDPYQEIRKLVPYALSWQVKENVGLDGKEVPIDLMKLKAAILETGFRGLLPFEALGTGDPSARVAEFLERIRAAFAL